MAESFGAKNLDKTKEAQEKEQLIKRKMKIRQRLAESAGV